MSDKFMFCPCCHSENVQRTGQTHLDKWGLPTPDYHCLDCNNDFDSQEVDDIVFEGDLMPGFDDESEEN